MSDPDDMICGIQNDARRGWIHVCTLPMGHVRGHPVKHHFEWVPDTDADPGGPGPENDGPTALPRRTPFDPTRPAIPTNPRNDPNVVGLPRRGWRAEPPQTDNPRRWGTHTDPEEANVSPDDEQAARAERRRKARELYQQGLREDRERQERGEATADGKPIAPKDTGGYPMGTPERRRRLADAERQGASFDPPDTADRALMPEPGNQVPDEVEGTPMTAGATPEERKRNRGDMWRKHDEQTNGQQSGAIPTSGGSGVASVAEIKGALDGVIAHINEELGMVQALIEKNGHETVPAMAAAMEGSSEGSSLSTAIGALNELERKANEMIHNLQNAIENIQAYQGSL